MVCPSPAILSLLLASNSPWRALVTAQVGRNLTPGSKAPRPTRVREVAGATRPGQGARYMWVALLARIYGVFGFQCSGCGGRVRLVGFITEPATVRQILEHVGERTSGPVIVPARLPPLALNGQQLDAPECGFEAISELEFEQTLNRVAEAGYDELTHLAGAAAEPIPEPEFDQTLGL